MCQFKVSNKSPKYHNTHILLRVSSITFNLIETTKLQRPTFFYEGQICWTWLGSDTQKQLWPNKKENSSTEANLTSKYKNWLRGPVWRLITQNKTRSSTRWWNLCGCKWSQLTSLKPAALDGKVVFSPNVDQQGGRTFLCNGTWQEIKDQSVSTLPILGAQRQGPRHGPYLAWAASTAL